MSRVGDRAFLPVATVALILVFGFAVSVFVGIDRSLPRLSGDRSVGEWIELCRPRPNYTPPPDCAAVVIDEPIAPSRRPYDPYP